MKNKFIKSTFILLIGGILTKVLSFVIRVYFTRVIGEEGINIYSLVMPTYSLLIAITQLGFPIAISNIISKGEKRGKKVIFSVIPISILLNFLLIMLMVFSAKYLSVNLLHNPDTYYPLIACSFVLPFISLSSILRGYFFGKQKMLPHVISNVIEQIFKLLIVLLIIPRIIKYGLIISVTVYILISILSEGMSIVIFLLFLPKGFNFSYKDIKPDLITCKEVLKIGLPSVGSRLIGNIGYFFEPIIFTSVMLKAGFASNYIISSYAVYNTYVLGVLLVPTYLLMAVNTALLPEISKNYNNHLKIKRILKRVLIFSFILGIVCNIILYFSSGFILNLIFKTNSGVKYIKFMSLFFSIYYLEGPISCVLQALNQTSYLMRTTLISEIFKALFIFIFGYFKFGIYSIIFAELINICIVIILNYLKVKKILKK